MSVSIVSPIIVVSSVASPSSVRAAEHAVHCGLRMVNEQALSAVYLPVPRGTRNPAAADRVALFAQSPSGACVFTCRSDRWRIPHAVQAALLWRLLQYLYFSCEDAGLLM
jgi:hypothetical protein